MHTSYIVYSLFVARCLVISCFSFSVCCYFMLFVFCWGGCCYLFLLFVCYAYYAFVFVCVFVLSYFIIGASCGCCFVCVLVAVALLLLFFLAVFVYDLHIYLLLYCVYSKYMVRYVSIAFALPILLLILYYLLIIIVYNCFIVVMCAFHIYVYYCWFLCFGCSTLYVFVVLARNAQINANKSGGKH